LCRSLRADGLAFVPVIRNPAAWAAVGIAEAPRVADIMDAQALQAVLADARCVVSCAHARHAEAILAAAPADARFVFLGSTRKFTRWPDEHGRGVIAGERAFLASGRAGVMLHPTMIYGAEGEDNVQRLAALLRRLPVVPLPNGGRSLVQPIHQSDVTRCLRAAVEHEWAGPVAMVIAGPEPVSYADFVRAVAVAAGLRLPRIIAAPGALLLAVAPLVRVIPGLPRVRRDEIRRLLEDKAFEIREMRSILEIEPMTLSDGLGRSFGAQGP
jgi:uncharacterized protein YbjT (DUF2867 family)